MVPSDLENGIASHLSFEQTLARLLHGITRRHLKIFATIDFAADAGSVGMDLRPTAIIIFGNPTIGTHLLQDVQTSALDLPLKVLVYQDSRGEIWITHIDPVTIAERHGLGPEARQAAALMRQLLIELAAEAASR
ncbi:DUF302 domain-containing protein [Sinorhizobium mexicanum]|uniref:DUF302 domain-containing protein n=1 Tax=Sinorhizobium mexicanum TaxID=375549 RepID=A0A859QU39_9HYPH|nr:DUF302 domain-containing protein [Sinorhizobium mexicanum]MBP1886387.1 uncharacterized protein (DUF302 family) [Sinorhizobium mexicanum]QLL64016.1 DUF302 domain-containing protein [Sinorhizobium mexicanum]